jgi:hypothetical protein
VKWTHRNPNMPQLNPACIVEHHKIRTHERTSGPDIFLNHWKCCHKMIITWNLVEQLLPPLRGNFISDDDFDQQTNWIHLPMSKQLSKLIGLGVHIAGLMSTQSSIIVCSFWRPAYVSRSQQPHNSHTLRYSLSSGWVAADFTGSQLPPTEHIQYCHLRNQLFSWNHSGVQDHVIMCVTPVCILPVLKSFMDGALQCMEGCTVANVLGG